MKKRIGWLLGTAAASGVAVAVGSALTGHFLLDPGPRFDIHGGSLQKVEVFSAYADPGAGVTLHGQDISDEMVTEGTVDTSRTGTYTITYAVPYGRGRRTVSRRVVVEDREAPELTLLGDTDMKVPRYDLFHEPGYTAYDRYDGDLTDAVGVEDQKADDTHILTYTVRDAAGNRAMARRSVLVRDTDAPAITLSGSQTVYIQRGTTFSEPGYTAVDDADGDVTDLVTQSGTVDTDVAGTYTLTYAARDAAGNSAEVQRQVVVFAKDSEAPDRIYLTFDDGPSAVTEQILNILRKNGIRATFFILNYPDSAKPLIQRMIDEGHTVAIHGYSHDYGAIYASDEAFMENIYRLRDRLAEDFTYRANIVRFPGGSSNTVSRKKSKGIMRRLTKRVEKEGFLYFDWNVSSGDASAVTADKETIIAHVEEGLHPGRGNVVLMHDSHTKTTTADALQTIIDDGLAKGYVFLPITAGTEPVRHQVAN